MAEDRIILLANRGDGVDEVPNDEYIVDDELDETDNRKPANSRHVSTNEASPPAIMYIASCVAAIGGLLFGYDMGIISGAKSQMQKSLGLSCSNLEWVVSLLPVGGLFASITGGILVDRWGRRTTIILNALLFTIGAFIVALSRNLFSVLFGRFILGFAVSLSAIAECIYIAEISIPNRRGGLVSLNELGITVGILISFLANYCLADVDGGWRVMFGMSAFAAIVQAITMFFLPKTPHFLMISRKEKEAEETIRRLGISSNVRQTIADIRYSVIDGQGSPKSCIPCLSFCNDVVHENLASNQNTSYTNDDISNYRDLSTSTRTKTTSNMCRRLIIGLGLVFFQQFTGQPNMIYYAADIFRIVGFCGELSSTLATVGLGIMKVLATIICLSLIDKIGRRIALIFGISTMGISLLVLTFVSFYDSTIHSKLSDSNHQLTNEACKELSNLSSHRLNATRRSVAEAYILKSGVHKLLNSSDFTTRDVNDSHILKIHSPGPPPVTSRKLEHFRAKTKPNKKLAQAKHVAKTRPHQLLGLSNEIDTFQSPVMETCRSGGTNYDTSTPSWLRYMATLGLIGYVCAYSFSFGPVTWVILSEIFPATSRGQAMAFTTSFNWLGNFIVSATFLQATHTFTIGGVFLFYAIMCVLALVFSVVLIPETKDKTLEEISKELNIRNFRIPIRRENGTRKDMVHSTGSNDSYSLPGNQYTRIPSNTLRTEM